jgi:hypothetical protein
MAVRHEQRRIVAYLESFPLSRVLRNRQERLASSKILCFSGLRRLQSAREEELRPLLFAERTRLQDVEVL